MRGLVRCLESGKAFCIPVTPICTSTDIITIVQIVIRSRPFGWTNIYGVMSAYGLRNLPGDRSKDPEYEIPPKETYKDFKSKGSWLKNCLTHPSAAGDNQTTKWDSRTQIETWGWRKRYDVSVDYSRLEWIGQIVGSSKGIEYVWNHQYSHVDEKMKKGTAYPVRGSVLGFSC